MPAVISAIPVVTPATPGLAAENPGTNSGIAGDAGGTGVVDAGPVREMVSEARRQNRPEFPSLAEG